MKKEERGAAHGTHGRKEGKGTMCFLSYNLKGEAKRRGRGNLGDDARASRPKNYRIGSGSIHPSCESRKRGRKKGGEGVSG